MEAVTEAVLDMEALPLEHQVTAADLDAQGLLEAPPLKVAAPVGDPDAENDPDGDNEKGGERDGDTDTHAVELLLALCENTSEKEVKEVAVTKMLPEAAKEADGPAE